MLASSASAGFAADPRIGDVQLGKRDGIAYVKDVETVVNSGSTVASTGCPGNGDSWRIVGGGYSAGKFFNLINMTRPRDYTDADSKADDYWEVESNAAGVGTKITGYAVCMKEPKLKYVNEVAPDSSDAERKLSVACPGKTQPIGGGASIGQSDSFLESLYPSGKSFKAEVHDASAGTGNFAADAICLKSSSVETVERTLRVEANSNRNVKVLAEAPAMAMGNLYQTQRGGIGIPHPGIPGTIVESRPFDGKDKDTIPDDGWQFRLANNSSKAEKVTVGSINFIP